MNYEPIDCLRQASKRDAEKGGAGWRSTREVADYCGIRIGRARVLLERLHGDQRIECAEEGRSSLWRISPALPTKGGEA